MRIVPFATVPLMIAVVVICFSSTAASAGPGDPAYDDYSFVNAGPQAATGLHVSGNYFGSVSVVGNAPGCVAPVVMLQGLDAASIQWSNACVDAGEKVTVRVYGDCPGCHGYISDHEWTFGQPPPVGGFSVSPDYPRGHGASSNAPLLMFSLVATVIAAAAASRFFVSRV